MAKDTSMSDFEKLVNTKKSDDNNSSDLDGVSEQLKNIREIIGNVTGKISETETQKEIREEIERRDNEFIKEVSDQTQEVNETLDTISNDISDKTKDIERENIESKNILEIPSETETYMDQMKGFLNENLLKTEKQIKSNNDIISGTINSATSTLNSAKTAANKMLKCASKLSNKLAPDITNFFKWIYTTGIEGLLSIKRWITAPFKTAVKLFDDFSRLLFGSGGNAIRYVAKLPFQGLKWFINVGVKAITFITKGVKTIFDVSLKAVKKTVSVIGFGFKTYFRWLGKLIMKTITGGPISLIAGIPLIVLGVRLGMEAIRGLLKTGSVIGGLLKTSFDLLGNVTQWIWGGIKRFFKWVFTATGLNDIIPDIADGLFNFVKTSLIDIFGEKTVSSIFYWIQETFDYITGSGSESIDLVLSKAYSMMDYVKELVHENALSSWVKEAFKSIYKGFKSLDVVGNVASSMLTTGFNALYSNLDSSINAYLKPKTSSGIQRNILDRNAAISSINKLNQSDKQQTVSDLIASMVSDARNQGQYTNMTDKEVIRMMGDKISQVTGIGVNLNDDKTIKKIKTKIKYLKNGGKQLTENAIKDKLKLLQQMDIAIKALGDPKTSQDNIIKIYNTNMESVSKTYANINDSVDKNLKSTSKNNEKILILMKEYKNFGDILNGTVIATGSYVGVVNNFRDSTFEYINQSIKTMADIANRKNDNNIKINQKSISDAIRAQHVMKKGGHSIQGSSLEMFVDDEGKLNLRGVSRQLASKRARNMILDYISSRDTIIKLIKDLDKNSKDYKSRRMALETTVEDLRKNVFSKKDFSSLGTRGQDNKGFFYQDVNKFTGKNRWNFEEPDGREINPEEFARGAVIPFNKETFVPLDIVGMEYIKETTKDLPEWETIKKKIKETKNKKIQKNIVVRKSQQIQQTHELYTIKQLSKGLINSK